MTQHTPTPWIAKPTAGHAIYGQSLVYSEQTGKDVAIVYDGAADAAFIAHAVNSHAQLVAALAAVVEELESRTDLYNQTEGEVKALDMAATALAQAKGP